MVNFNNLFLVSVIFHLFSLTILLCLADAGDTKVEDLEDAK